MNARAGNAAPNTVRLVGGGAEGPPSAGSVTSVATWLEVVGRLSRGTEAEKASIREELGSHMRERVRDLMVSGRSEAESVRIAIAEVGDASELAGRFNQVRRASIRRIAMNVTMIGMAGAALVTSIVALGQGAAGPSRAQPGATEPGSAVAPRSFAEIERAEPGVSGVVTVGPEDSVGRILEKLATAAGMKLELLESRINDAGIELGQRCELSVSDASSASVLTRLNERLGVAGGASELTWRSEDGMMTFGPQEAFDRKELELVAYDISRVVSIEIAARTGDDGAALSRSQLAKEVSRETIGLFTTLVYPQMWQDNGGDIATAVGFGETIFVTAPKRFHPKIAWLLERVTQTGGQSLFQGALLELQPGLRAESVVEGGLVELTHAVAPSPRKPSGVPLVDDLPIRHVPGVELERCRNGAVIRAEGGQLVIVPDDEGARIVVEELRIEKPRNR